MKHGKLTNVWWNKNENGGADLYVNDKLAGHIDDLEDAQHFENNIDSFLRQQFSAGFDRGVLAGGIVMILGGVAIVATKLMTGV